MFRRKRALSDDDKRLRELKLICMENLLAALPIRMYFKDLESRFLLVSQGSYATSAPSGHTLADLIGKTDFDFYSDPVAP
jgi:hypothetical protein